MFTKVVLKKKAVQTCFLCKFKEFNPVLVFLSLKQHIEDSWLLSNKDDERERAVKTMLALLQVFKENLLINVDGVCARTVMTGGGARGVNRPRPLPLPLLDVGCFHFPQCVILVPPPTLLGPLYVPVLACANQGPKPNFLSDTQ